jgi:hypothetical protein
MGLYGDDHASAVDDEVADKFNMITVCEFFKSIGMILTPASNKAGEISKFIPVSEMTFLKRNFREIVGGVDAPLKWESIFNSVQYYKKQGKIDPALLQQAVCSSALIEMSHYPEDRYEDFAAILRTVAKEHNWTDFKVYSYSEIRKVRTKVDFRVF